MLDLPSSALDQVQVLADWVELTCLTASPGVLSQSDLADVLIDAGLKGDPPGPSFIDVEAEAWAEESFETRDTAVRFVQEVWRELHLREQSIRRGYPFRVDGDLFRRTAADWKQVPAYSMLLLADVGRRYSAAADDVQLKADSKTGRLFEKIVEASLQGLIKGKVVRFGWPRDAGWPTNINDRIKHLAERLELETENLAGKTHPNEKDRGLDVVAQLRFGDGGAGSVILLTQCAVGNAWRGKIGEPSLNHWRDIYKWNAQLLRTIAVPWRLSAEFDVTRTHRLFDAIVLDRPRLSAGKPDRFLDSSARKDIVKWCEARFGQIPELKPVAA
jgi:hypothetical protein